MAAAMHKVKRNDVNRQKEEKVKKEKSKKIKFIRLGKLLTCQFSFSISMCPLSTAQIAFQTTTKCEKCRNAFCVLPNRTQTQKTDDERWMHHEFIRSNKIFIIHLVRSSMSRMQSVWLMCWSISISVVLGIFRKGQIQQKILCINKRKRTKWIEKSWEISAYFNDFIIWRWDKWWLFLYWAWRDVTFPNFMKMHESPTQFRTTADVSVECNARANREESENNLSHNDRARMKEWEREKSHLERVNAFARWKIIETFSILLLAQFFFSFRFSSISFGFVHVHLI